MLKQTAFSREHFVLQSTLSRDPGHIDDLLKACEATYDACEIERIDVAMIQLTSQFLYDPQGLEEVERELNLLESSFVCTCVFMMFCPMVVVVVV